MPASRPYWKGYLKLSLVSCPIALYTASASSERVSQEDREPLAATACR
jgi:DNA end-binding protein Ku